MSMVKLNSYIGLLLLSSLTGCVCDKYHDKLSIVQPVEIIETATYKDGGTNMIHIKDAKGKEFTFCINSPTFVKDRKVMKRGMESRSFYINAKHPSDSTAIRLEIGDNREKEIYDILVAYMDEHFERKDSTELFKDYTEMRANGKERDDYDAVFLRNAIAVNHMINLIEQRPEEILKKLRIDN